MRIIDAIALGAVAIAAGVGGFKLRELIGNFSGENITESISNTFSGLGESVGNVSLPSIQGPVQQSVVDQSFTQVPQDQRTPFDALGAGLGGLFASILPQNQPEQNIPSAEQFPNIPTDLGNRPLDLTQLAANFESPIAQVDAPIPVPEGVAPALGGGPSFIGGTINEIPISELSLGQIIDRFGVTASQASNIQAQAQNNFDDFDFGTNTGGGINSVIPNVDINTELSGGTVSNPQFEGLSAIEIANMLTGGNINNFQ